MMRRSKFSRRGFTLVEMLIAAAIGAFVTLAAVAFASQQTRLLGLTTETLEASQFSRFALERLSNDLRMAGAGIGYDETGAFGGIELGSFTRGGAQFQSGNRAIQLESGTSSTDDIGLVLANGGYATIANYNFAGAAQVCRGSNIQAGEVVLFRSEDGLTARTVRVTSIAAGSCSFGMCRDGCDDIQWTADSTFLSGPDATSVSYAGGEASGGFDRVTWFVDTNDPARPGAGRLRRAEGDCATLDSSCGELIADGVESLQFRVFEWRDNAWFDATSNAGRLDTRNRIRVDVEIVLRSRAREPERPHSPITSLLEPGLCFPNCGTNDEFIRQTISTSAELKNSGRQQYRREQ